MFERLKRKVQLRSLPMCVSCAFDARRSPPTCPPRARRPRDDRRDRRGPRLHAAGGLPAAGRARARGGGGSARAQRPQAQPDPGGRGARGANRGGARRSRGGRGGARARDDAGRGDRSPGRHQQHPQPSAPHRPRRAGTAPPGSASEHAGARALGEPAGPEARRARPGARCRVRVRPDRGRPGARAARAGRRPEPSGGARRTPRRRGGAGQRADRRARGRTLDRGP